MKIMSILSTYILTISLILNDFQIVVFSQSKSIGPLQKQYSIPVSVKGFSRGVNIGNALEAPYEGAWGVYVRDEYFEIIRRAGFDTVRIPVKFSGYASKNPPYTLNPKILERVSHIVGKALEQNLTVIIDMHHYDEIMQNPNGHRERFLEIWRQLAEHFKDYPKNLYFELLNEPHDALTNEIWNSLVKDAVRIIRETNPTRKIVIGPTGWNSAYNLEKLEVPDDPNIIATFHFYTPFEFTHQGADWVNPSPPVGRTWTGTEAEKRQIRRELDIAAQWAKKHNITIFMGEFGAYSKADMDSRVRWTYFVAREAEERGIPWCYWEFCSGFGVYDPNKNEWRAELLNALIPRARNLHFVSVENAFGRVSGEGLYEEGSYATIRIEEIRRGFLIQD
ncbi:MAG: glycoside hydrolase family 5 protein, partial [Thermoproteota archaeon]